MLNASSLPILQSIHYQSNKLSRFFVNFPNPDAFPYMGQRLLAEFYGNEHL
jgi:hypothetical protein